MGLLNLIKGVFKGAGGEAPKAQTAKCPNCDASISLDMERCPGCGVHVKSMFRRKCPKCETLNDLDIDKCKKCSYDFKAEITAANRTVYRCPRCQYRMETLLTKCPSCSTGLM